MLQKRGWRLGGEGHRANSIVSHERSPPGESKFQSTGHPARVTSTVETRERTLVCFLPVGIKQRQGLDWRSWKQLHEGRLLNPTPN